MEIIGWNNESNGFDTTALVKNPYTNPDEIKNHDVQEVLNKQIQNFVNANFTNLVNNYYNQVSGSSSINVMELFGQNSRF